MTCTFFGHRDTPWYIEEELEEILKVLITKENADNFLVGNQGNFDVIVLKVLRKLEKEFPHIKVSVVLAYMPMKREYIENYSEYTIFPQGLENVPPRLAIVYRNRWMLEKSCFVVTYVCREYGGAYKFLEISRKKNKRVINLYENNKKPSI